jgi:hypothetical protein
VTNVSGIELPREADVAREIRELISKVVSGTATDRERDRLSELSELRSTLLTPAPVKRFERRKKHAASVATATEV